MYLQQNKVCNALVFSFSIQSAEQMSDLCMWYTSCACPVEKVLRTSLSTNWYTSLITSSDHIIFVFLQVSCGPAGQYPQKPATTYMCPPDCRQHLYHPPFEQIFHLTIPISGDQQSTTSNENTYGLWDDSWGILVIINTEYFNNHYGMFYEKYLIWSCLVIMSRSRQCAYYLLLPWTCTLK